MGLGKILGSISPAFGLVSGKGLFGDLGHALGSNGGLGGLGSMGGLGLLLNLIGGHHGADGPPAPTGEIGSPAPLASLPGGLTPQNVGQMAPGTIPGGPSALDNIGSALSANAAPDPGLGPLGGPPQPHNSGILQSLLAEPSGTMGGGGLQALLMHLGIMR